MVAMPLIVYYIFKIKNHHNSYYIYMLVVNNSLNINTYTDTLNTQQ